MNKELIYVEVKSGYRDNGPAWIGFHGTSKSGSTIYFNGLAFQSLKGRGMSGNYFETESGEEYWISGVKKKGGDRHWAGSGKIIIDKKAVDEFLTLTGLSSLPPNIEPEELLPSKPTPTFHDKQNKPLNDSY